MFGSTIGNIFKITTWGESHGKAIGVVIDGCPSGIKINKNLIKKDLIRRKTNNGIFFSSRNEEDSVKILSGVFKGVSTGTPISFLVYNNDSKSKDYDNIKDIYRPGHADYTYNAKYGVVDYRGGGRASGRETVSRVIAGSIAKQVLSEIGISFLTYTSSIGSISIKNKDFKEEDINKNEFFFPDNSKVEKIKQLLAKVKIKNDSIGGTVTCKISGVKAGIGEPVFDKLDAALAKSILSIGAIKGIEFGLGFKSTKTLGSLNNDGFYYKNKKVKKYKNSSGGILGGLSDGSDIEFKVAVKPTPSIAKPQNTVTKYGKNKIVAINGRHDVVIVPRVAVVIEAMAAITLLDFILLNLTKKIENIKRLYL